MADAAPGPQAPSGSAGANSSDGVAYLRAQGEAAAALAADGDREGALRALDRSLSLIASLTNPQVAPEAVATAVSEALALLVQLGEAERAWGLYRATGDAIAAALPAGGPQAAAYRLAEAQLLQQVGDPAGAIRALDLAAAAFDGQPEALGPILSLKAVLAGSRGDLETARAALAASPYAPAYAASGRTPSSYEEVVYLAARAYVTSLEGEPDPVVALALQPTPRFAMDAATADLVATYRLAGLALASPPGAARAEWLSDLARRIREGAARDVHHRWARPGAIDQILIGLALSQPTAAPAGREAEAAFALFQLAGRNGRSFDADALAALAQARDEAQRRTIHQALRLRARRDRLVRIQAQAILGGLGAPAEPDRLRHDAASRLVIRDFDRRIAQADASLAGGGVAVSGGRPATLARLQAVLAPDEAALAMAPTADGFAYMCVRKDRIVLAAAPADAARMRLDTRLVQASLTAGHAPSEQLDAQFPAEAAVRLYDVMIRPFAPCLASGDRIAWLSTAPVVPLSALLSEAPPRLARGYDLAAADWLVRRHAVTYAGSAAMIVASRTSRAAPDADFDFLGVGDPVLDGAGMATGPAPDVRRSGLKPLPETRDELEASARGFRAARLLLGEAATERGLRGEMVGAYRYLSFATHGLLREDLQGLADPALVLTPGAANDPVDDGLLTASEIADLNLRAAFVALSACNTANVDLTQMAQDLPALASAFAVAGVPATLGTLWPVETETGKQVVTGVFERLRGGRVGPAEALAQAQRAFLAAPPGRAWLHPRFWAPFVTLGDGGAAATAEDVRDATLSLASTEVLTRRGGEVLALDRSPAGLAARFISDADARGRQGAAVRATGPDGAEVWRAESHDGGSARFLARFGPRLLAGGYRLGRHGRYAPALQAYDAASGAPAGEWIGEGLSRVDAFILAGAVTGPDRAVIGVGELNLRDAPEAGGGRLHVLEVGPDGAPRPLFTIEAPAGVAIADATITPIGARLLITYTDRQAQPKRRPEASSDDYDTPACLWDQTTWLELRDAATGALIASERLDGVVVVGALPVGDGTVRLGGSRRVCGEEGRATVVAVDGDLRVRALFDDQSLGESEVRVLAALPGRRLLAAASKATVVDYRPPDAAAAAGADPYAIAPFPHTYAGMVLTLGRDGAVMGRKLLDSGSNIYVTAAEASVPGEVLVGGAVGGQAAILRLTEAEGRR